MPDSDKMTSGHLINADKVQGTNVYNMKGDKHDPLPWATLKYDASKAGSMINRDKARQENAPAYNPEEQIKWTPDYGCLVGTYYKRPGDRR